MEMTEQRSAQLRSKIALLEGSMQAAAERLWTHERFTELYPWYLRALHSTIRASGPLLRFGERRSRELGNQGDPVAAQLADYFGMHAEEEENHDIWVLEDLEVLGIPREQVLAEVPSASAAALVGAQFFWIETYHPIALLGYLAVLERPVDPEYFRRLSRQSGLPEAAFSTLIRHAELDDGHCADLDRVVDSLPLTPEQESLLGTSAIATAGGTAVIFNEVVTRFEQHA